MGLKRKRNLKVDAITKYNVFILSDLDSEYLEDYIEARDTGMEADEEKEIQLQKIILGSGGNIPLPVITQIDNPARKLYGPTTDKRYIRWDKDVPNECIENYSEISRMDGLFFGDGRPDEGILPGDARGMEAPPYDGSLELMTLTTVGEIGSAAGDKLTQNMPTAGAPSDSQLEGEPASRPEQEMVLKKVASAMSTPLSASPSQSTPVVHEKEMSGLVAVNSVSENMRDAFSMFGNSVGAIASRDDKLINYVLHRVILRYERAGYEAYTCFRRRVFHPTFKSRRNEAIMLEKLERMSAEFHALEDLCSMLLEKTTMEHRYLRQTNRLVEAYHSSDISKGRKRRYRKQILGAAEAQVPSRLSFNVHAMMTNRDKIAYLKNIKLSTDILMDVNYHSEIGPLLWGAKASELEASEASSDKTYPHRKKVCHRCENKWGGVFYTDDRKHKV